MTVSQPTIFIATPSHDGRVCTEWVAGALCTQLAFPDATMFQVHRTSVLPWGRDDLTQLFLESPATHMLCVDADIGWGPQHLAALLKTGKSFVSGVYAKKTADRLPPVTLAGHVEDDLLLASGAPGGFLLLERSVVEAMVKEYAPTLSYTSSVLKRPVVALWEMHYDPVKYDAEDFSFCKRWTAMGGAIWVHPGVVLDHIGDQTYRPAVDWIAKRMPVVEAAAE
jgi:hypothetical protein